MFTILVIAGKNCDHSSLSVSILLYWILFLKDQELQLKGSFKENLLLNVVNLILKSFQSFFLLKNLCCIKHQLKRRKKWAQISIRIIIYKSPNPCRKKLIKNETTNSTKNTEKSNTKNPPLAKKKEERKVLKTHRQKLVMRLNQPRNGRELLQNGILFQRKNQPQPPLNM